MAIMHPNKVYRFNTLSEKKFYDALKEQLSDKYEVFYSVSWHGKDDSQIRTNSESDFIIVDREKGFLCIEVKGGVSYTHENDRYIIKNNDGSEVVRRVSAFEQAEKSMHYFHDIYEENYKSDYHGVYGFIAAFPFYKMKDRAGEFFQVPEIILDLDDMNHIEDTIRKAFIYWQGRNKTSPELFIDSSKKKLCDMLKRVYSIEASKGAFIDIKKEELERINNAQDSIINLLGNYQSFAIKGAAGTGKSWIAFKMALNSSLNYYRKTLLISKSRLLSEFFQKQVKEPPTALKITDFDSFLAEKRISDIDTFVANNEDKYTAIIVDEAQDFTDKEALFIRTLLSEDSGARINIFYDDEQNLDNDDEQTLKKFYINTPPYVLTENLRNTKNIYEWAKERTSLGEASFSNQIDGIEPIHTSFRNEKQASRYLEGEINKLLSKDTLSQEGINIVIDDDIYDLFTNSINDGKYLNTGINIYRTKEYKGLEANVIFYIHKNNNRYEYKYVGLTRARFILYDIDIQF